MSVKQSTIQRFVLCCIQPVRYKMIKDHRVSGGLFSGFHIVMGWIKMHYFRGVL